MEISKRREKILEMLGKKRPLSYEEILDRTSKLGDPIDILSDLDLLVFFQFLQHIKVRRKLEFDPTMQLDLRSRIRAQMKDDPEGTLLQLKEIEHEFPAWYKKLAILTILRDNRMELTEISEKLRDQYPHLRCSRLLIEASLKILEGSGYVSTQKDEDLVFYTLTSDGVRLLKESPFHQFSNLRKLKDEFTAEFQTYEILELVRDHDKEGITFSSIIDDFKSKYGIRGSKRRAIMNTLQNMAFSGLVRVSEGTVKGEGHKYYLGMTARSLLAKRKNEAIVMVKIKPEKELIRILEDIISFVKSEHLRNPRLIELKGWYDLSLIFEADDLEEIMEIVRKLRRMKDIIEETSTLVGTEVDLHD